MDKQQILKETEKFVRTKIPSCRKTNKGSAIPYLDHVFGVRKYGLELAKIYHADEFVVETAALLHDIGADAGENHAQESVIISTPFLKKFNLPDIVSSNILDCIANHSIGSIAQTDEQQIIQDADGIIFIEDTYKTFFEKLKKRMPLEEARNISIKKTKGMLAKIKTKRGIEFANKKLAEALKYLESAS